MKNEVFRGIIVPILTPVDEEERIDEIRLRRQVDYLIEHGMHGILAFGSNGEFYQVEEEEMRRGLSIMVDQAAGRVPVFFGIGAIGTRKCVRLARMAIEEGADAISVLQPMFLKPNEEELFLHFKTIAQAADGTPMLLYNNPGRVGYSMSVPLVERLAHEADNVVGIKDSSGDMTLTQEYIRRCKDVDFLVFGGKDTLLYTTLCVGGAGGVCTSGNFVPELVGEIYRKYTSGDREGALQAQFRLNPVRLSMDAASFPVATKDMAKLRGRDMGKPFLPNLETEEGSTLEKMRDAIRLAGLSAEWSA